MPDFGRGICAFTAGLTSVEPRGRTMTQTAFGDDADSVRMVRFLNQQNIERYLKLLPVASDETQRRQLQNLLEEEWDKAAKLTAST
jgi:hypothetical protein